METLISHDALDKRASLSFHNTWITFIVNKDYIMDVSPDDWRKINANGIMMIDECVAMQPFHLHKLEKLWEHASFGFSYFF